MGMLLDLFRNKWPYTDFHELNADWVISTVRELIETMDSFIQSESISFADPITWNISTQYAKATVVIDNAGNAYLSKQAVPAGIQLNNNEYWQEIFNFTTYTRTANRNLTFNVETDTTRATAAYSVDDWLILNDVLYKVTQPIAVDDTFIIAPAAGSNILHFTVEDFIKAWITTATALINQYKDDIDASELEYRQQLANDVATTTASLQAQLDLAISGATVDSEVINARLGADGVTYSTLGEAIRTQIGYLIASLDGELYANRYVKYNELQKLDVSATSARPAFYRYGNIFNVNGGATSTREFFKLSTPGDTNYSTSYNTASNWVKEIPLKGGHTYLLKFNKVKGEYTVSEGGYLCVTIFRSSGADVDAYTNTSVTFAISDDITISVAFRIEGATTFTDCLFACTIEDITEDSLTTDNKTVVGGLNEVNEKATKSLTALWTNATPITANTDLNDIITEGNYRVASNATAETVLNLPPEANTGRLFVLSTYREERYMQLWFQTDNGLIWGRTSYRSGSLIMWRPWRQFIDNFLVKSTMNLAYSWWVNNHVIDNYGNLYFGYIGDNKQCGVGCRFVNGSIKIHDLFASENKDDHNAPSVILVNKEGKDYVCVIGSTGHNTDGKINCYIATANNTVDCEFEDKSYDLVNPTGVTLQCSYSQAYFENFTVTESGASVTYNRIINFFRVKQIDNSTNNYHMIWCCAISDDYGDTWKIYRVFTVANDQTLFYMWSCDVTERPYEKRIVIQENVTNTPVKSIRTGVIDCYSLNIYGLCKKNDDSDNLNKPMTLIPEGELPYDTTVTIAMYDDFYEVVHADSTEYFRYRILDVLKTSRKTLYFLYAKSVQNAPDHHDAIDWTVYRYANNDLVNHPSTPNTTEIANIGCPYFLGSSYVTGAAFINDADCVVYAKNDTTPSDRIKDGPHSLHKVIISNNIVDSDVVIKTSERTIARPVRYDRGCLMYLIGKYLEGTGTRYLTWDFSIGFIDSF